MLEWIESLGLGYYVARDPHSDPRDRRHRIHLRNRYQTKRIRSSVEKGDICVMLFAQVRDELHWKRPERRENGTRLTPADAHLLMKRRSGKKLGGLSVEASEDVAWLRYSPWVLLLDSVN